MPNKIITQLISSPKMGDIYRSGFDEVDNERYILCSFGFEGEAYYMLVSLRSGNHWRRPSKNIQDAVKDAIFVGRDMTITLS